MSQTFASRMSVLLIIVSGLSSCVQRQNAPNSQVPTPVTRVSDEANAIPRADTLPTSSPVRLTSDVDQKANSLTHTREPEVSEIETYLELSRKENQQWKKFRNDEGGNIGKIVYWKVKASHVRRDGYVYTWLRNNYFAGVVLASEGSKPYSEGNLPKVREDDWLEVKGRFESIDDDGNIVLEALEVKNLGVE